MSTRNVTARLKTSLNQLNQVLGDEEEEDDLPLDEQGMDDSP